MDREIIIAIFGLIGTLLGVVLGAFLNQWLSKGKSKIWVKEISFYQSPKIKNNESIERKINPKHEIYSNECEVEYLKIDFDLYNSSTGERRIIRELSLSYNDVEFIPFNNGEKKTSLQLITGRD